MKKFLATLVLTLCCTLSFAQSESTEPEKTKPMRDTEIVRNVSVIDIEGNLHNNVEVTIKSISADYLIYDNDRVKVTIKNEKGKKVWKKTFHGQIQVGKTNFDQLIIFKSSTDNRYIGVIREKEGIY